MIPFYSDVGLWRPSVDLHDFVCARVLEEVAEGE